jgi:DNA (cytosine-5)-methyltransferase 1
MAYKFIDLFAGIGGFHIALHNLGAECVFASEWDEAARKTYEEKLLSFLHRKFRRTRRTNL